MDKLSSSQNTQLENNQPKKIVDKPRDFKVLQKISGKKHQIYLAHSESYKKHFALKVFPYINRKRDPNYENEQRFNYLKHENIISSQYNFDKRITKNERGEQIESSLILMEYAQYGTLYELIFSKGVKLNDKIIVNMFHQLVDGLNYIHSMGIYHLDLKLQNIMIGEGYKLKIIDFDLACTKQDKYITSRGTRNHRAPELLSGKIKSLKSCDVYSLGIILFLLKSGGVLPFKELSDAEDEDEILVNLHKHLDEDPKKFWEIHCELQEVDFNYFPDSMKSLFQGMCAINSKERLSLNDVMVSSWYHSEKLNDEEYEATMKSFCL